MNIIKKISIIASSLLFLLAQIFSLYLIFQNHMDKLSMVHEDAIKRLEQGFNQMLRELESATGLYSGNEVINETLIIYAFRNSMPAHSAIYKGSRSLYNNSSYEFEKIGVKNSNELIPFTMTNITLDGKNLTVWYLGATMFHNYYMIYHVLDVSDIYDSSKRLILQEITVSFFLSLCMITVLNFLIRKITKPLHDINETQRQLIGNLSHELKTPLTAMKGYSETILKRNLSKEQQEKALSYIYSECDRLSRLSEKMMQLTRLYEPEHGIMIKEQNLSSLLESVNHTLTPALKEKNIELLIHVKSENLTKKLDPDLFTSLIINLVNNGIAASQLNSRIWIEANEQFLQVRDEGCGISKEEIEKVKNAFYRSDKSRSHKCKNLGLGLALCEQIAKVHGANLLIESKKNYGTSVFFIYESFTKR